MQLGWMVDNLLHYKKKFLVFVKDSLAKKLIIGIDLDIILNFCNVERRFNIVFFVSQIHMTYPRGFL